jgi:hypothetical protein
MSLSRRAPATSDLLATPAHTRMGTVPMPLPSSFLVAAVGSATEGSRTRVQIVGRSESAPREGYPREALDEWDSEPRGPAARVRA